MPDSAVDPSASCDSPPPAALPARDGSPDDEPRRRLHQLAMELMHTHNRRLVAEYLRLRRVLR